ncbi:hypothetical protein GRX01_00270 [Halobaculum sp. WSA2]|uniref:Uncharacterized protein n=1 Tax=Halobaculum saliterrae TaxID=2073113 RepID=A0A6B0SN54_9EURY|nr:hypothetical protein [Halobaculum saliterrae]MXR39797.1 hypothetical protein [Halobaculum saliterrae]
MADVESGGTPILYAERRVTCETAVSNVVLVAEHSSESAGNVTAAELALRIARARVESGRHTPHPDAVRWQLHCGV